MKFSVHFALMMLFSLSATAAELSFPLTDLRGEMTWEAGPSVTAESILRIYLSEPDRAAVQEVKFDMPSMGHGSSPTRVTLVADQEGRPYYRVDWIFLRMDGEWEAQITIANASGQTETAAVRFPVRVGSVNLPQPGGQDEHQHGHHQRSHAH